jgi:hypothetical protein
MVVDTIAVPISHNLVDDPMSMFHPTIDDDAVTSVAIYELLEELTQYVYSHKKSLSRDEIH